MAKFEKFRAQGEIAAATINTGYAVTTTSTTLGSVN
jgi:hypothetical protein